MQQLLCTHVNSPLRIWVFVFQVTLLAIFISLLAVAAVLWFSGLGTPPLAYLIAGVVPLFVVLPVTYRVANIAYQLTRTQEELFNLARIDELTGLHNRRAFFEQGNRLIAEASANGVAVGLLLIDADNFKQVNDSLGHIAGDDALRNLAQTITACAAPDDLVVRFGGDEFALLRLNATGAEMAALVDVIRRALAEAPFVYRSTTVTLAISAGVADSMTYQSFDSLLLAADIALYDDKAARHAVPDLSVNSLFRWSTTELQDRV